MKTPKARLRRVLVADDDDGSRSILSELLRGEGFEPLEASDGRAALDIMQREHPDVVLLDVGIPGMDSVEVLARSSKFNGGTPVIVMTGLGSIDSAVQAVRDGAYAYLTKPLERRSLALTVRGALEGTHTQAGRRRTRNHVECEHSLRELMGSSDQISHVVADIELVAETGFTVLICGETGSGKELVARGIHRLSERATGAFVPVDCGSIPPTLIESELFGHEKGSYTGAVSSQPGKFEMASGGTLFLDEVGNLPPSMQPKLLRALQERQVWRVGSTKARNVDIRVIVATNQDLVSMVQTGRFRRDLYYRLNEFSIRVPPLRERRQDTVFLAHRFLDLTNRELDRHVKGFSDAALHLLLSYSWPGNVRELRNVVRRAVLLGDTQVGPEHLRILGGSYLGSPEKVTLEKGFDGTLSLKDIVRRKVAEVERDILRQVLRETSGNKAEAARMLKVDYKTIQKKVKEYGIARTG